MKQLDAAGGSYWIENLVVKSDVIEEANVLAHSDTWLHISWEPNEGRFVRTWVNVAHITSFQLIEG